MPSHLKPDAKLWSIPEQVLEDPATGLSIQFEIGPDDLPRIRLFGEILPMGNREIGFDTDGRDAWAGTSTQGICRPAWLTRLD